ncbi:hypothetical protein BGZ75_000966, partial [Mortierella antarctica]
IENDYDASRKGHKLRNKRSGKRKKAPYVNDGRPPDTTAALLLDKKPRISDSEVLNKDNEQ